ncbi:MAG: L-fucose/L-arabinose isomerase family protein [Bryobacteraceae bacterium]
MKRPEDLPAAGEPFRVGILSFSDGRRRVHETLAGVIERHDATLRQALARDSLLALLDPVEIANSSRAARDGARKMQAAGLEAAIFNIPVFAFPNYSLLAARLLDMPLMLVSPKDPTLPGLGGIMAAHGAMAQIGLKSYKLWGDVAADAELSGSLSAFCRASGVIRRMRGSVYGLIGGRSIGMNTGAVSPAEWMKVFGVDVEHIDQLEIVRRAAAVDEEEVERAYAWLTGNLGKVSTEGKAAPEHVKQQIRHYIATRGLIEDFGLDFVSVKCHYDLSEYFVTNCLSAMALNDPYDWNGPKRPTMMACEADGDGALTMQVLKLISGYPSLLFDMRSYDQANELFVCCNCGAQPSWYAARSEDPNENLAKVFLEPVIPKYGGGGGHFAYVCREGPVTVARLTRVNGRYRMFLAAGEFVNMPREKMRETCAAWPHGYLRMNVKPRDFLNVFNTNHAHVAPGDHREALRYYCRMMDFETDLVN